MQMPTITIIANQRNAFHHHPRSLICTQLDNTTFPEPAEGRKKGLGTDHQASSQNTAGSSLAHPHHQKQPYRTLTKRYKQMLEFIRLCERTLSPKNWSSRNAQMFRQLGVVLRTIICLCHVIFLQYHETTILVPSLTLQQVNNTAHYTEISIQTEIKLGIKLTEVMTNSC